jgi:transposase
MFMQDRELYRQLLGLLSPWSVDDVKLDINGKRVDVFVGHPDGLKWPCPTCKKELPIYDHSEERTWRHLDTCQCKTYLHAKPPRVNCPEHGVRQVILPWAEDMARFTAVFERFAIDVLQECSIFGATEILDVSWDEAFHIMCKAVGRGLIRKDNSVPALMGIDEKSIAKGQQYLTIVDDIEKGIVDYVGETRTKECLEKYFKTKSIENLSKIKAIATDMWDPYISAIRECVPEGEEKIVFDKYHVLNYLGKAVDDVRKDEHKALTAEGIDLLKGTKYLWLYNENNIPSKFKEHFDALKFLNLKTGRAWAIKELFREFYEYTYTAWAGRFWKRWFNWATHSRLTPIVEAAKTLGRHIKNILTYFRHPITNATSEGLNSKIQTIKKQSYGFSNPDHFKQAIYFHCGGLDLYPVTHGIP